MGWPRRFWDWLTQPGADVLISKTLISMNRTVQDSLNPAHLKFIMSNLIDDLKSDVAALAQKVETSNSNTDRLIAGMATLMERLTAMINSGAGADLTQLESLRQDIRSISDSLSEQLQENARSLGLYDSFESGLNPQPAEPEVPETPPENPPATPV